MDSFTAESEVESDVESDVTENEYNSEEYAHRNNSNRVYIHSTDESDNAEADEDEDYEVRQANVKKKNVIYDDSEEIVKNLTSDTSDVSTEDVTPDGTEVHSSSSKIVLQENEKHNDSSISSIGKYRDIKKSNSSDTSSDDIILDESEVLLSGRDSSLSKNGKPIIEESSSDENSVISVDEDSSKESNKENNMVMLLAKEEVGIDHIDPVVAQKRAFLVCKLQQLENQLNHTRLLLSTANIDVLPDKGAKLCESVISQEKEIEELRAELNNTVLVTPVKKETFQINPNIFTKPLSASKSKELGKRAQETHDRELSLTVDRLQSLHSSLVTAPTENDRADDPRGLKVKLMPHQQHALAWLTWREQQRPSGGVLADDMGLGKTLTMIALIIASLDHDNNDESDDDSDEGSSKKKLRYKGGTLVVCPASLLSQWESEIINRCKRGTLSVDIYHSKKRESVPKLLGKNDVVITTYNTLAQEFKANGTVYKIHWRRVILDEAHVVRNHKTQTSAAVCGLTASKRWALTGTPIQNKETDLYAILKFLKCSPFDDLRVWKRWVDNKNSAGHHRLAALMKTLMLRRTKQELQAKGALECLPDKCIEVIKVNLDEHEQLVYKKVLVYSRTLFAQFLAQKAEKAHMTELYAGRFERPSFLSNPNKSTQFTKAQSKLLALHADIKSHEILVLLLRLRQICCHPALINAMLDQEDIDQSGTMDEDFMEHDLLSKMNKVTLEDDEVDEEQNEIGVDTKIATNLLTSQNPVFKPERISSKMRAVLEMVQDILKKGDKLIIVSQWAVMLDVVASHLSSIKGASYQTFTGKVAIKDRQGIMDAFNDMNSDPKILLLSLTAGGVGLNLVGGNHLLLIDNHWNPQLESQAQDRIYRFGQTKNVFIYKFVCKDTIEERIENLQMRKLELAQKVLSGGGNAISSKLSFDDLKSLFSL